MEIQDIHSQFAQKLKEWDGHYYLNSSEDDMGVVVGRVSKVQQTVCIEMLNAEHPDREKMELEIRRMLEGTDWRLGSDGFLENGFSDSECLINIHREVVPEGDLFRENFEKSIKIN